VLSLQPSLSSQCAGLCPAGAHYGGPIEWRRVWYPVPVCRSGVVAVAIELATVLSPIA